MKSEIWNIINYTLNHKFCTVSVFSYDFLVDFAYHLIYLTSRVDWNGCEKQLLLSTKVHHETIKLRRRDLVFFDFVRSCACQPVYFLDGWMDVISDFRFTSHTTQHDYSKHMQTKILRDVPCLLVDEMKRGRRSPWSKYESVMWPPPVVGHK